MIILRVEAEQLHRYRKLRLADLPERGIIALSGDNESGKSGIGEIICFALFGRTYALAAERIGKLVHWGAGEGVVTLRFRTKGRTYELTRRLVRDGEQSARLVDVENPEEPLERGAAAVTEEVERLLGCGFDAYSETFYLAQREITTPHPHGPAVRAMVGVTPLKRSAEKLAEEANEGDRKVAEMEKRLAELDAELATVSADHSRVKDLEVSVSGIREQEREISDRIGALESAGDDYCDACRGMGSHGLRRFLAGSLSSLTLLAFLSTSGVWALLKFRADIWPTPGVRTWLQGLLADTGLPVETAVAYVEYGLGALLLVLWIWLAILALGTRRRRARARRLYRELDLVEALEPAGLSSSDADAVVIEEDDVPVDTPRPVDRPDAERRSRLQQRILGLDASEQEVRDALAHEMAWLRRRLAQLGVERNAGAENLERARSDRLRYDGISGERADLEVRLATQREQSDLSRLAHDLLQGAARDMSKRFSEHLRGMVSRALPRFTDGRYDHLEVDEALQVRVYSGDKRNLLDLDEISSGTQRQILLALRLGLSQELVSRLVGDDQFAFLDEPFAFFDSARMRAALRTLLELGGDVVQFWVVAQRFPQDTHIGLEIPCGRHPDTLEIGHPETE
jgi:exonuclease SbcC